MSAQNNIKPLVDGILQNPLEFKPASKLTTLKTVSSETLKNPAFIIISSSAKQAAKSEDCRGESQARTREREEQAEKERKRESGGIVPKSMAEAIALYSQPTTAATATAVVRGTDGEVGSRMTADVGSDTVTDEDKEKGKRKKRERSNGSSSSSNSSSSPGYKTEMRDDAGAAPSSQQSSEKYTVSQGAELSADDIGEEIEEGQILESSKDIKDFGSAIGGGNSVEATERKTDPSFSSHAGSETEDSSEDNDDDYNLEEQSRTTESDDSSGESLESSISDTEKLGLQEKRIEYERVKQEILQLKEQSQLNHAQADTKGSSDNGNGDGKQNEEENGSEEEELKHKRPLLKRMMPSPPSPTQDLDHFYKFNEEVTDEGTYLPSRILKSWGPELGMLKPRGLLNHGVTCYMNAAVQAMLHIPALQHYLFDILAGKYKKTISPESVSMVLAETSSKMWLPNEKKRKKNITFINPKKLIGRLDDINCMMSEWQQEDSHEYFMSLMSRLQEDSVPKGHKLTESIVYDIFGGMLKQYVTCKSCGEVSKTEQPFYDLSLHLKAKKIATISPGNSREGTGDNSNSNLKKSNNDSGESHSSVSGDKLQKKGSSTSAIRCFSIEKSINDFFNPELIKIDNEQKGYVCEKCHKTTNAVKRNTILRAPETLLVHLKKFRFNGTSSSKMKQAVSFPIYLDLTQYRDGESTKDKKRNLPIKYQLISVVVHEGHSLSSGHYIAHCKQPDGTWATYDDEYINRISEADVLRESNAYYLVYTRLTPKDIKLRGSLPRNKNIGLPPGVSIENRDNSNSSNNINRASSSSPRGRVQCKRRRNKRRKLNK